jgi:antitoxin CptB
MLELDLILGACLDRLEAEDLTTFERLLESADVQLIAWLRGDGEPDDPHLHALVARIR